MTKITEGHSTVEVPSDGVYSTYTKITDVTLDAVDEPNAINVTAASVDETNGWAYFIENGTGNDRLVACKLNGSGIATLFSGGSPSNLGLGPIAMQSVGGTISVWADGNDNYYVSSKGVLITTINTADINASVVGLAISVSGKYIMIVGGNSIDTKKAQLQIWRGS